MSLHYFGREYPPKTFLYLKRFTIFMNDEYLMSMQNATATSEKGIIYLYTFDNGKQYVGQTRTSVKKRYGQHLAEDNVLARTMKTHKHMVTVLETVDLDELDNAEVKWISDLNTLWPKGYNFTSGGEHNTLSEYSKEKISLSMTGEKNPGFGKSGKYSSISKAVYMYSKEGKFLKEFESMNLAQESTGISFKHISRCCSGKPDGRGYLTKSAGGYMWKYADGDKSDIEPFCVKESEYKNGRPKPRAKAVVGTHIFTGEEIEFESACEASRQIGISQANISACIRGARKKAGDYKWRFKE